MKIITVEEHYESAKITQAINQSVGKAAAPNLSPDMLHYMRTSLPTPEIMQDFTDQRLTFMAHYGIDQQVLSYGNSSPQNLAPALAIPLCRQANDELAQVVAANPTRFGALAALPVGDPAAAAAELKRAITELHFNGVLLKGNYQGKFFDNAFFFPIFKMASDLDVPIYFHPSFIPNDITQHYFASAGWSDVVTGIFSSAGYGWHMDVGIQVMRMIISGIFDKLPNLKLISGYWGELVPQFLERLDDELDAYAGLKHSFSDYYRQNVYVTPSGILSQPQLNFILAEMGPEHLIYSIDYPYKQPANTRTFLDNTALTSAQLEAFSHGNAERVFHLK
ncbi:amidohydrolase family protein [Loigolactobacillus jiayinensis]|uniref:Amidohydrolase family protein n=1 Tax=Loigolactobacillus jiayinensis TaxID=2486016 RepID=A0ABW1RJS0_9LACO|nr:amidohydrolase family protein [Loigolactobacillus jiayinensis]